MKKTTVIRCLCVCVSVVLLALSTLAFAQTKETDAAKGAEVLQRFQEAANRLTNIQASLFEKRQDLEELQRQLETATNESEKQEIRDQLDKLKEGITKLNQSFEQIVIGGIDMEVLSDQQENEFDWRYELIQITKPLLTSLKELTEKPRKVEKLRSDINLYEDQLKVINNALDSIKALQGQSLPPKLNDRVEVVAADWQQRKADTENALEIARFQLATLLGQDVSSLEAISVALEEFLHGRGLTLFMALLAMVIVWLVMRSLLWLYQKRPGRRGREQHGTRTRVVLYSYRLFTTFFAIVAVLMVFYIRGDLLLMALSLLGLVMLILGLRQTLPRYIAETRLLLNIGPVRSGERIIYNGLPLQVKTINMYSVLRNPELEGVIRLPLGALNELVSRPSGQEPWFPCRPGEYVMLPEGRLAMVMRQTLELVQLKVLGSIVQFPTADFLQLNVRNLSREGFSLAVTFGIDYRHQAICLEQVPQCFNSALTEALENAELTNEVESILVDFKEAGTNSLDYLIYLTMGGQAAGSYFKIGRLVQQTCVRICNREGWGIPFTQLTVHQGEGFDTLRQAALQASQPPAAAVKLSPGAG